MSPTARPIRTLLVANRGEIAIRVIDAAHELGIRTVGVYAESDRASAHVQRCDVAVSLSGETASETYLDQAKLLDAALATGADAVHPGYGFLSEHAGFAQAVVDAGLIWVGPHPAAIRTMGDKLAAKRLAAAVGVPTLASTELAGEAEADWARAAAVVGYPLLVKAAAGGGGRGMRLVADAAELGEAVRSARREAEASFGDPTVFAERWLAAPRHIEIQVVGDQFGNVVHLGERECSIQRRHQKLIEEAPSPAVDAGLRDQLGAAALELARAIRYDSVGTVEFLLDADRREFFFLEMNTRIQVEHRVTEEVTGCDLLWWQFQTRAGRAARLGAGRARARRTCSRGAALRRGPRSGLAALDRHDPPLPRRSRRREPAGRRRHHAVRRSLGRGGGVAALRSAARQGRGAGLHPRHRRRAPGALPQPSRAARRDDEP